MIHQASVLFKLKLGTCRRRHERGYCYHALWRNIPRSEGEHTHLRAADLMLKLLLQVKGAQEHGAAACLIYSDPRDDGTVTVDNGYAP